MRKNAQIRTPGPRIPRPIQNVMANWSGYIFSATITFFLTPFVVQHLGSTGYGVWTLLTSLTGYLGLLDLGVRGTVTRYIARFHAQADHAEASRATASALAVFAVSGSLAVLISVILAAFAVDAFNMPDEFKSAAKTVFVVAGFTAGVSLVSGVFGGVIAGLQRFGLLNMIENFSGGLRALAIVMMLSHGYSLQALALIHLAFSVLNGLAYGIASRRLYPELSLRLKDSSRSHLRMILSFSTYLFILNISNLLIFYTDTMIIGAFLSVSMITFFAIAGTLMSQVRVILRGITTAMTPLASSLDAHISNVGLQSTHLRASRYATMVIAPILVTFMLRGESFINLWMGDEYGELSGRVLLILALALLLTTGNHVSAAIMVGMGRHKGMVPIAVGEALCNLLLSILLVQSLGVEGVAWGTAIPNIAFGILCWPWYIHRTLGVSIRTYLISIWLRPGTALILFALASASIEEFWPATNLVLFFSQVAMVLPLALVGYWWICFDSAERQSIRSRLWHPSIELQRINAE